MSADVTNLAAPAPRDPACNAVHSEQASAVSEAADREQADEANPDALQSAGVNVTPVDGTALNRHTIAVLSRKALSQLPGRAADPHCRGFRPGRAGAGLR